MCDTCGCHAETSNDPIAVEVLHKLTASNDAQATHNRQHLNQHQVLCLNLMSSPGAGKTRLLQTLIEQLQPDLRIAVIEGDLETENDAERIRQTGVEAIQINTGTACHLDAQQIHHALHHLPLEDLDVLFIENVGNLVCPASFDLGQHKKLVLLACTEGDDKPAKYPVMFRTADLVLISKCDLLPYMDDFNLNTARENIARLASQTICKTTSAKSGDGLDALCELISTWVFEIKRVETVP